MCMHNREKCNVGGMQLNKRACTARGDIFEPVCSKMSRKLKSILLIDDNPDDNFYHERVINKSNAAEKVLTKTSAKEALDLGIIYKVVAPEELDNATNELAQRYASGPTKTYGMIKKMLNKAYTANLPDMLQYEAYCQEMAGNSEDYKEGVAAFLEKRKAVFLGK